MLLPLTLGASALATAVMLGSIAMTAPTRGATTMPSAELSNSVGWPAEWTNCGQRSSLLTDPPATHPAAAPTTVSNWRRTCVPAGHEPLAPTTDYAGGHERRI